MHAEDRYLTLHSCRNRTASRTLLRSSLAAATERAVSTSTVRRRLHEGGLYARRPAICMLLMSRRDHLHWARQHVHWTPNQWRAVLFKDESRFSLESDSRRALFNTERNWN
ncbi:Transposable element Tcb1 transposase, partial [Stegodyphus mimosarum]